MSHEKELKAMDALMSAVEIFDNVCEEQRKVIRDLNNLLSSIEGLSRLDRYKYMQANGAIEKIKELRRQVSEKVGIAVDVFYELKEDWKDEEKSPTQS